MADITDIKAILYTEKTIELQENGVIVVQTSPRMTRNGFEEGFKDYFGVTPSKVNSVGQDGKVKRFRGKIGKRADFKKFYVTLPEGAAIANLSA